MLTVSYWPGTLWSVFAVSWRHLCQTDVGYDREGFGCRSFLQVCLCGSSPGYDFIIADWGEIWNKEMLELENNNEKRIPGTHLPFPGDYATIRI